MTAKKCLRAKLKKILSDAIDNENKAKPLTDDMLCKILNKRYNIARRTVANMGTVRHSCSKNEK